MSRNIVEIKLEGTLARYLDVDGGRTQVRPGQTIMEAAAGLGIPGTQPLVALVNGQTHELTYLLEPGDQVRLIPPIAGGC